MSRVSVRNKRKWTYNDHKILNLSKSEALPIDSSHGLISILFHSCSEPKLRYRDFGLIHCWRTWDKEGIGLPIHVLSLKFICQNKLCGIEIFQVKVWYTKRHTDRGQHIESLFLFVFVLVTIIITLIYQICALVFSVYTFGK